jgi:hypothetical protein
MTLNQWAAIGVLASAPFAAMAQQAPQPQDPLDANATVPASTYDSALKNYLPANRGVQASPDKAWRAANDQAAKSGGHTGHATEEMPAPSAQAQASPMDHSKHR